MKAPVAVLSTNEMGVAEAWAEDHEESLVLLDREPH